MLLNNCQGVLSKRREAWLSPTRGLAAVDFLDSVQEHNGGGIIGDVASVYTLILHRRSPIVTAAIIALFPCSTPRETSRGISYEELVPPDRSHQIAGNMALLFVRPLS